MAERAYINKNVLKKLRELKKVSFVYIENFTAFKKTQIDKWEDISLLDERSFPTIAQAKKLAACYRVPFAAFFMDESNIPQGTLPHMINKRTMIFGVSDDESAINLAIYDLVTKRDLYLETSNIVGSDITYFNPPEIVSESAADWASSIRDFFNLSLTEQFKLKSKRQFYLYLRNKIEQKGIFVNCFFGVRVDDCRGLAIYNDTLPIIGINSEDRPPAKSFSIIHEIVHIFRKTSSFCNTLFENMSADSEEIFCNAVAGEVLVPSEALQTLIRNKKFMAFDGVTIESISKVFSVSREVIARRLLNMGEITSNGYDELIALFAAELKKEKEIAKAKGSLIPKNVPRDTFDKFSNRLCVTLLYAYGEGIYSRYDVASYLAIKPKHIDKLFGEVYAWNL